MKQRISQIILLLLLLSGLATSCRTTARGEKFYERQAEKDLSKEQQAYDKAVDNHKMSQTKETRKMLKKLDKQSKRLNKPRKPKSKPC